MNNTLQIIIGIIGSLIYLYLCWRTMKDNYSEEDVIAFGWVSLIVYLIGSRIAYTWAEPRLWLEFWKMNQSFVLGGYVLWLLLAWLVTSDRGWKFFVYCEDSLINLGFINFVFFMISGQWKLMILLGVTGIIGWFLKDKYRSLWWYKSGKKGFLFLAVNAIFFIGVALIFSNYYYLIMTLLSVVGLAMLGNERYSK